MFQARPSGPLLKVANGDIWFFTETDWSQECCHGNIIVGVIVSFVMYIAGAKFEEHCLNISRVILDCMLCCFSGTTYDVIIICIIQKREYLQNEKRYSKKENALLLYSKKPFKQAAIIFYFIGTSRVKNISSNAHNTGLWHLLVMNGENKSLGYFG